MSGLKKKENASADVKMREFQSLAKNTDGSNSVRKVEGKSQIFSKGGGIKTSELSVSVTDEEITGIVVSPEYLNFLEKRAQLHDKPREFTSNFTSMCIRHLLDEGYSISGSSDSMLTFVDNAVSFIDEYKKEVENCQKFFLNK